MEIFNNILQSGSALQAIVIIFLIIAVGLMLGRVKIAGVSLGATFVFFCGILAGHIGISTDPAMMMFAQDFGLIIFVYALGLQVGPGFFNSFRKGGIKLNIIGLGVILLGTVMAVGSSYIFPVSLPDMIGILCGATTNTPALGAAQQTLEQFGMDSSSPALGCAVTYPLGVIGVIIAIILLRKFAVSHAEISSSCNDDKDDTFIATFIVTNPIICGKAILDVAHLTPDKFVISRIWRNGKVIIPNSTTSLEEKDKLLVISRPKYENELTVLFGIKEAKDWNKEKIDWNAIDPQLISHWIVVTRPEINGKSIDSLKLRNRFKVNISRVSRAGIMLLATPDLILRMGDRLIVVGREEDIDKVESLIGNTVKTLREPNLVSICIGVVLGLLLGALPIAIPGISAPIKLGIAGGPIIIGILMGAFGPRIHMVTYTTESANLMLRRLGLSMYLACLGLSSGSKFFETVFRPEGLLWISLGFAITIIPVVIMGIIALKLIHIDFGTVTGMLCGSMANPMALNYASENVNNNHPALSYTQVYPLCMFVRVILAQITIVLFL